VRVQSWHPPRRLVAVVGNGADVEPRAAAQLVAAALEDEPGAVMVRPSPRARAILTHLPASVPVVAVLPDMARLLRDVEERGAVRAVLARVAAGGIAAWPRLALTAVRHLTDIVRQDFRGIVPLLIDLDRAGLGGIRAQGVALAAPLTDLLLAAGHGECLAHVVTFLERQAGTRAGFETLNLGHLLPRLAAWGIAPDFVIGPLNPRGFRMKPSTPAVLEAARGSATPVLASEVSAGGTVPLADGIAYATKHGAAGVVLALDELANDDPEARRERARFHPDPQ
jgi:hypothetical protein